MINTMENANKNLLLKGNKTYFKEISLDSHDLLVTPEPFLPPINDLGKHLLQAAQDGDLEEVKNLLQKGAPFTTDWLGTGALHLAAQNNHLELCELLLNAGSGKDAKTKVDRTPLHMAAYEGHLQIVECLLKHEADIDSRDLLKMTPLHWAVQNGHAEVVACLVRNGALTNVSNNFDLTPLDIAAQIDRSDIVQIIKFTIRDPLSATRHLTMELNKEDGEEEKISNEDVPPLALHEELNKEIDLASLPCETVILDDEAEDANEVMQSVEESEEFCEAEKNDENSNGHFSESFKILQQHGITMLPIDNSNILNAVMETGHSVVLTEAGKQALNSIKSEMQVDKLPTKVIKKPAILSNATPSSGAIKKKKIITVTSDQFLAMTANGTSGLRIINGKLVQQNTHTAQDAGKQIKRIVMKKDKVISALPESNNKVLSNLPRNTPKPNFLAAQTEPTNDIELLMEQLRKAHRLIENYKQRLAKSELETLKYKKKCRFLLQNLNKLKVPF